MVEQVIVTRFFVEIEETIDGNPLTNVRELKGALDEYYKVANVKVQEIK